jgi:excisionase family DNA binding protein
MANRLLLKADEVAAELGMGRSKIYELMASGAIPVVRIGRAVRVPRAALEAWIARQTRQSCGGEA